MPGSFMISAFLLVYLLLSLFLSGGTYVHAATYKYVDRNGSVHFTDRLESIPQEYRNQIKLINERNTPKLANPQKSPPDQSRELREAEEKKKAETKAMEEKSSREQQLRQEQEIRNQIANLQEQVKGKKEEQAKLRTTWMVNDRNRLNQLNQEISALEQEVRFLQHKVDEVK